MVGDPRQGSPFLESAVATGTHFVPGNLKGFFLTGTGLPDMRLFEANKPKVMTLLIHPSMRKKESRAEE